jgi:octaprenyl-diphosphate synthase
MQPTQIHDVVATEFSHVNDYILSQLKSEIPLIEQIGYYIISNGGKRLRPLLVLLAARASQPESLSEGAQTNAIKMASIVEFIHTATLLHDDVVDESDMRRGKKNSQRRMGQCPECFSGRLPLFPRLPNHG